MPAKTSSTKNKPAKKKLKKLSRYPNMKQMSIAMVIILVVTGIGTYSLRRTFALRQSPSILECQKFSPYLYKGVRNQDGCVAALQGFYHDKYGVNMSIDGIFGQHTEAVTQVYQATRLPNYPAVPVTGKVEAGNYNKTWAKITLDCYNAETGKPWAVCNRHFRY
ncbi:MAG TPA: hypothetical protein VK694_04575 [Verrucomicrobiae bacterium]|nr:hypothetical protein [Verrucomicrobiae bacterium]